MPSWTERHLVNRAMRAAARLGRDIDGIRELEVLGRRTGKPRRTPVKVLEVDGERYLVSLYANSGWVRNLRAHGSARLRLGRRLEEVVGTELSDDQKPPIIRAYLAAASREQTRQRLMRAAEDVPEEDVRRGAPQVPVFRLSPARRNASS
jgi:deazaflavin-dependent oxidoreductase (nitroreductase family)